MKTILNATCERNGIVVSEHFDEIGSENECLGIVRKQSVIILLAVIPNFHSNEARVFFDVQYFDPTADRGDDNFPCVYGESEYCASLDELPVLIDCSIDRMHIKFKRRRVISGSIHLGDLHEGMLRSFQNRHTIHCVEGQALVRLE